MIRKKILQNNTENKYWLCLKALKVNTSKGYSSLWDEELTVFRMTKWVLKVAREKKSLHSETLHHKGHSVGICDSCNRGTDHTNSVKCLYSFPLRYIYKNNFEAHRAKDTVYIRLHRYLKSQLLHRIFLTLTQPGLLKSNFSDFCLQNPSHKAF